MKSSDPHAESSVKKSRSKRTPRKKHPETEPPESAGLNSKANGENTQGSEIILYSSPMVTVAVLAMGGIGGITLADVARLTGVHAQMVRYYCQLGLLAPFNGGIVDELIFDRNAVEDVLRIEHYRYALGVKRRALTLICELRREASRQHMDLAFLQTSWGRS